MTHEQKAAEPQVTRWGPVDRKEPGIVAEGPSGRSLVPWNDLKQEIESMLFPQVRVVPAESTAEIGNLGDRENWIVRILDPAGIEIGNVWFGVDPDEHWKWDGLVRLGDPQKRPDAGSPVWQTFRRYSDGSYRRIKANVIESPGKRRLGF